MASRVELCDILTEHGLIRNELNIPCPAEACNSIAMKLDRWELLGSFLGLTEEDHTAIREDYKGNYAIQRSVSLNTWRRQFGSKATYLMLAEGLEKIKRFNLVGELCVLYKDSIASNMTIGSMRPKGSLDEIIGAFDLRFKNLVISIRKELIEGNKVSVERMLFSTSLLAMKHNLPKENMSHLYKASNLNEIFMYLNLYWSTFDYTLLEVIIKRYGSETLKKQMESYVSDMNQFMQRTTVADFIPYCKKKQKFETIPEEFIQLEVLNAINKPISEYALMELEELRRRLYPSCQLPNFVLILYDLIPGSGLGHKDITFGAPSRKRILSPLPVKQLTDGPADSQSQSNITSDATRKRIFSHLPAKPLTDDGGHESWSQPILYRDEKIPGVVLVKDQRILEKISSAGKKIDHESDAGISIDIPEGSISPDESVDLLIQPSFSGSFKIPEDMVPASPAYLIETSKRIVLKKPLTMRMQHSAKLKTEEDCKNIVFLRASSDPEYRGSDPVYVFRKVEGARGTFNEGSQFGEVALTHFSWWMAFIRLFGIIGGENLYSARLYNSLNAAAEVSAVFCMCPHHTIYTQFCDKSIPEDYFGLSTRPTVHNTLAISSDAVALKTQNTTKCIMDKSEISKVEIDYPLINNREDPIMVPDYPPRISITCTTARSEPLTLSTEGLEKDCTFTIIPAARMSGLNAYDNEALPIKPKYAISDQTSVEDEANKDEASKDGASKDGASKDGASKDGASKDGASKDGASKDGASKDGASNWKIEDKTSLPLDANKVIRFLKEKDFPASKAKELGVCLDVPQGRFSTFETNHPNNADRVLIDVITYWIDNKEASWDKLATALEECDHAMMAKKIQRHYTVACSHDDAHTPSS